MNSVIVSNEVFFSIVILTFNREEYIKKQLDCFSIIPNIEIIIVDNHSDTEYAAQIATNYPNVSVIRLNKNYGAVGRNYGIAAARAPLIITLDDDVWGITNDHLSRLIQLFEGNVDVDCVCFHIVDEKSKLTTNWIHHCHKNEFDHREFETYEISEGAAAFRKSCFDRIGLYPEKFFISHEGPDLAFRIINSDRKIIYSPDVQVTHAHAKEGRTSWRRYYYDTRNLIWLAYRNYNKRMLIKRFIIQLAAMFFYSVRDGYISYFFKALFDGISELKKMKGERRPLTSRAYKKLKMLDKNRPSLLFYIRERVFKREIKI